MMNEAKLIAVIDEAKAAAKAAADKFFVEQMGGEDRGACGFAWVNIYQYEGKRIDGRTKIGRLMKKVGVGQDWRGSFQIWNPARVGVQNIDTLEAGARAAAEVLVANGFVAYAGSRLD